MEHSPRIHTRGTPMRVCCTSTIPSASGSVLRLMEAQQATPITNTKSPSICTTHFSTSSMSIRSMPISLFGYLENHMQGCTSLILHTILRSGASKSTLPGLAWAVPGCGQRYKLPITRRICITTADSQNSSMPKRISHVRYLIHFLND